MAPAVFNSKILRQADIICWRNGLKTAIPPDHPGCFKPGTLPSGPHCAEKPKPRDPPLRYNPVSALPNTNSKVSIDSGTLYNNPLITELNSWRKHEIDEVIVGSAFR